MQPICGGGGITQKALGLTKSILLEIRKTTFKKIEEHAEMVELLGKDLAIEESLLIEIKSTLSHNNQSYVQWCAQSYEERNKNKLKLTVIYDMGWQKRLSGRGYDSSSSNDFIIYGVYKGNIYVSKLM